MKGTQRLMILCCLAVLLMVFMPVPQAYAAHSHTQGCPMPSLGTKVPVILVHGFIGNSGTWGNTKNSKTMLGALSSVSGIYPETIDYSGFLETTATHWVSDDPIGPALARRIDYLAQTSIACGGPGKVVIVAHSMGGLATRFAATLTINGHKVSDELGLVVTIGTPNFGTLVGDAFGPVTDALCLVPNLVIAVNNHLLNANAEQCQTLTAVSSMATSLQSHVGQLPMLPQSIPLMGIAGDVHGKFDAFKAQIKISDSDTLVLTNSALVGHSQEDQGAGTAVFHCNAWWLAFIPPSDGNCAHGNLPNNPEVQAQVVTSIQLYLNSLRPKPTPTPTPSEPCPTWHQVEVAIIERETSRGGAAPIVTPNAGPVCQGGFAGVTYYDQTPNGRSFSRAVLRFMNGVWESEGACHNDATGGYCDAVPSKIDAFFHQQGVAIP